MRVGHRLLFLLMLAAAPSCRTSAPEPEPAAPQKSFSLQGEPAKAVKAPCGGCCADATWWVDACAGAIGLSGFGLSINIDCKGQKDGQPDIIKTPTYEEPWATWHEKLKKCVLPPLPKDADEIKKALEAQEASQEKATGTFNHAIAVVCRLLKDNKRYECMLVDRFATPERYSPVFIVEATDSIPITDKDKGEAVGKTSGPVRVPQEILDAFYPGCKAVPTGDFKKSNGLYRGPHPTSCIAEAPPSPYKPPNLKGRTCFYLCEEGKNRWTYSKFSDCTITECDLGFYRENVGKACEYPSNLFGTCPPKKNAK